MSTFNKLMNKFIKFIDIELETIEVDLAEINYELIYADEPWSESLIEEGNELVMYKDFLSDIRDKGKELL